MLAEPARGLLSRMVSLPSDLTGHTTEGTKQPQIQPGPDPRLLSLLSMKSGDPSGLCTAPAESKKNRQDSRPSPQSQFLETPWSRKPQSEIFSLFVQATRIFSVPSADDMMDPRRGRIQSLVRQGEK